MIVRLIVRRLLFLVFVLFGLSLITFTLSRVVPGDPARLMAGPRAPARARSRRSASSTGWTIRCRSSTSTTSQALVQLDFGTSFTSRRPVARRPEALPAGDDRARRCYAFLLATLSASRSASLSAVRRDTLARPPGPLRLDLGSGAAGLLAGDHGPVRLLRQARLAAGRRSGCRSSVDPPATITSLYTIDALLTGNWRRLPDRRRSTWRCRSSSSPTARWP